ncbi:MAG: hypothetical protein K8L99_04110 [Anaerolineae bacterium]|nr:hypothetical protein [Anaerolineae bacterium]
MAAFPVYAAISGVFSFGRGSLILTGVIRGLGNTTNNDVVTVLTGTALVSAECVNKGGNVALGRNPIEVAITIQSEPLQADSNGNASVYIRIPDPATISPPPVSPTPKQAGCPNGKWSVRGLQDGSARWQSARVVVLRNGSTELLENYTCTDDGTNISCTPA